MIKKKSNKLKPSKFFKKQLDIDNLDFTLELIWRYKFIFFLFILIGYSLGGVYNKKFVEKIYKSTMIVKEPSVQMFSPYGDGAELLNLYAGTIKLYLHSKDNLKKFIEINDFKIKRTDVTFFSNNSVRNSYNLIYPAKLDGARFITEYIDYTIKKATLEFKSNLVKSINNNILKYENALEISIIIGLEEPIVTMRDSVVIDNEALFYQGQKVLGKQILHFEKLLKKLKNDLFIYDHILDEALIKESILMNDNNINKIIGVVISIIFVFLFLIISKSIKTK